MNSTNTLIQCATTLSTDTYQQKSTIFKANKTHIDTKVWCLLCAKDKEISREGREGNGGRERGRDGEREREREEGKESPYTLSPLRWPQICTGFSTHC